MNTAVISILFKQPTYTQIHRKKNRKKYKRIEWKTKQKQNNNRKNGIEYDAYKY